MFPRPPEHEPGTPMQTSKFPPKLGKRRSREWNFRGGERVAMRRVEVAMIVVFVIAGLYLLLFHKDPFPLNHESIGLGNLHMVHDAIGIVLIVVAVLIWWRSRRSARATTST
jgi:hypothetical protein